MRKVIISLFIAGILAGCKSDDLTPPPEAAVLSFPAKDQACTQGTVISAGESSVLFKWNAAANTDSYELDVKNLLTGISTSQAAATNQLVVTLESNTPYSWYVVSKSTISDETAKSETWKFYNSGQGTTSYAPFPAEAVSPSLGEAVTSTGGKITLRWNGSDADNDIAGYDVYFGTATTPALFKSGLTDNFLADVAITPGTTYYWEIITKDAKGNTSSSGIFQFKAD